MNDFGFYFRIGWDHIISVDALDHLYFISALAVVFEFRQWKQILILVTAFTLGHALTLFLSAMDIFRIKDAWVEFAIPCTIVISSLANFRKTAGGAKTDKLQYAMALVFGLIHGMGYANTIRFVLSSEQSLLWSLFSFNVGLEMGQIIVVLLMLLLGILVTASGFLKRREWVLVYSTLIFVLSLQIAIERNPFV